MSALDTVVLALLLALVCVLLGYAVGRRVGLAQSAVQASAATSVRLRQQLLATGVCPTCDQQHSDMIQYAKKG